MIYPISVCMVVQNYYPFDPRVRRYVNVLRKKQIEVTVICLKRNSEPKYEIDKDNTRIYRIPVKKERATAIKYMFEYIKFFIVSFFKLTSLSLKNIFDIIHVHNLPDFLVFSAIMPKMLGSKIILDMHEIFPEFIREKFTITEHHLMYKIAEFLEKLSINFAHGVICIHDIALKQIKKRNPKISKMISIMNTENLTINRVESKPKSKNYFTAIYNGTINENIHIDFTLEAINKIKEKIPKFRFLIYGEGPNLLDIKNLIKELKLQDLVFIKGRIDHNKMKRILKQVDLGILTPGLDIYSQYFFANKLSEWISMGIPVIVSNLKTYRHYFRNSSLMFVEPGNIEDISKAIIKVYKDEKVRKTLVENSYQDYSKIEWKIMEGRYLDFLSSFSSTSKNELAK